MNIGVFLVLQNILVKEVYPSTNGIDRLVGNIFNTLMEFLWNLPRYSFDFIIYNIKPLLQILVLPGLAFILIFAIIAVWFERKFLARAMLRVGPYYCGKRSGLLQVFADFLKLFFKEIIIPTKVDWPFFTILPVGMLAG
jgi:NADH:ubiquinone oxidoreductase subunit H